MDMDDGDSVDSYDSDSMIMDDETVLQDAKADTVRLLIGHGAEVTAQDETCLTPLHLASSLGSTETVQLLIEHGADVNAKDGSLRTPLHLAASRESGECATLDPAQIRINGQDEWFEQSWKPDFKIPTVQLLIRHGADVDARDDTHSTPLHLASSKECAVTADLLIRHGADVNAQNGNQSTPLHLAAGSRLALEGTVVRLLLHHGANTNAKDSEGRTPLEIALLEGNSWIAKLLSEYDARR